VCEREFFLLCFCFWMDIFHSISKLSEHKSRTSYLIRDHRHVTRSQTTGWSPEQRPFVKKNYFPPHEQATRTQATGRLPNHEPRVGRPNRDHLWEFLDIFHTTSKLPEHKSWVGHLIKDHEQVTQSRTTGWSPKQRPFKKNLFFFTA